MTTEQQLEMAQAAYVAKARRVANLADQLAEADRLRESALDMVDRLTTAASMLLAVMQSDPEADPKLVAILKGAAIHTASRTQIQLWAMFSDQFRAQSAAAERFTTDQPIGSSAHAARVYEALSVFAYSADRTVYDSDILDSIIAGGR